MRQYFGTDGIRGRVGQLPITPEFVLKLGYAAGRVLCSERHSKGRPRVLVGKDTRVSGYLFESALEAGLIAAGADVLLLGPMPTPAVAYLTRALRADAGAVISASHNPYHDNGIKFFNPSGAKLDDRLEKEIERMIEMPVATVASQELGRAKRITDAGGRYVEFCKSTFPMSLSLKGMKIVLDCANGACYQVAPLVFHELGAEVICIGTEPDGLNINDHCGSTNPEALMQTVLATHADLGIAFDGDGDRVIMVDEKGTLVEGDAVLYILARHLHKTDRLNGGVVGTLMSNIALEEALASLSIPFVRARVGDRYVLEELIRRNWLLGGENSGHILYLACHTTGDGIITALQVLAVLCARGKTLGEVYREITLYPQKLINLPWHKELAWQADKTLQDAICSAKDALANCGRILVRPSGTEPLLRILIEAADERLCATWAERFQSLKGQG